MDFKRRAPQARGAGIVRPGGHQHRAAFTHIARDIVEIDDRQHALARVAVEDNELELVDLLLEQFARGEGDQRELVDRCAVLFFRRTQNGEMDQIDAWRRISAGCARCARPHAARRIPAARAICRARRRWKPRRGYSPAVSSPVAAGRLRSRRYSVRHAGCGHCTCTGWADLDGAGFDGFAVAPYRDLCRTTGDWLVLDAESNSLSSGRQCRSAAP